MRPATLFSAILTCFLCAPFFARAEDAAISIGVMAPLTGDFASAGENIQHGITLAQEDLNAAGINVVVHFEDACLPAAGVAAFKKLVGQDHVEAIV